MKKDRMLTFPHNDNAEKVVLASLIIDNSLINEALETIIPEYFYSDKHRTIYKTIIKLAKDKKPVDLVILRDILKPELAPTYLSEIISSTPTSANFPHYLDILKSYYVKRRIIEESSGYIDKANSGEDYSELLGDIYQTFSRLAQEQIKSDVITPAELAKMGADDFNNRLDNKIGFTGLSSGYTHLDRLCGGFGKGDLIIIAGTTSIGKSAFLLDIAHRLCFEKDSKGCVYFSLEMGSNEIFYRLLSKITGFQSITIKTPNLLRDEHKQAALKAISRIYDSKFFLDITPVLNANSLLGKAKKIKAKENIDLICVDYIQLISSTSKNQPRHEILSDITKDLKQLARELDVPVIAGAQLNRSTVEVEGPRLSHIGESFAIVQHADTVILISRKDTNAILDVAKARQAQGGKFELNFDYRTVSFVEKSEGIYDLRNDRY